MKSEKCRKSSGRIINAPAKGGKSITNLNFCVMKNLFKLSMALFIGAAMFSCQQAEEPTMDQGQAPEIEGRQRRGEHHGPQGGGQGRRPEADQRPQQPERGGVLGRPLPHPQHPLLEPV